MFRKKLTNDLPNPKEKLFGKCSTCHITVECERKDAQQRQSPFAFGETFPAMECPNCKAMILLRNWK